MKNNMIEPSVLERLEFGEVLEDVSKFLYNSSLRDEVVRIKPLTNNEAIKDLLYDQRNIIELFRDELSFPFRAYSTIDDAIKQIRPESSRISERNAIRILSVLELAQDLNSFAKQNSYKNTLCKRIEYSILPIREVVQEIHKRIDLSATVKDSASSTLKKIRQLLEKNRAQLRSKINDLAKYRYKDYLVDDIVTYKNDRLVLAVKSEHTSLINGTIQGYSDTGLTVYMEPEENSKIHIELNRLLNQELRELDKILRELAEIIRPYSSRILENIKEIMHLDIIHSKAKYAWKTKGHVPNLNTKSYELNLINAYHPLLLKKFKREDIVPLNIKFGAEKDQIVLISGPNAGGKTVSLKTIGLLQLMLQSGIAIPCDEGSSFPVFENIFCDIGDNQSIQNDLSTFTSHLERIREIVERGSIHSLVLIDELGTGTDPIEGAALSRSLLKKLLEQNVKGIATTHLSELKLFANSEFGLQNASMEFNEEKLESTYRLVQGIPGSSYAFYISEKMGLDKKLIANAKNYVGDKRNNLEDLIQSLNQTLRENKELRTELDIKNSRVNGLEQMYERKLAKLKDLERKTLNKAIEEAESIISGSNRIIENTVAKIKESNADKGVISKYRQQIKIQKDEITKKKKKFKKELKKTKAWTIEIGDRVRHKGLGVILDVIEKDKDLYILASGSLQLKAGIEDLEDIMQVAKTKQLVRKQESASVFSLDSVRNELDIRGLTFDEAWTKCDDYLDHALHTGWESVTLIHGKGTGVLRDKINEKLRFDKRIKSKRLGNPGEGDAGVTVVTLRY